MEYISLNNGVKMPILGYGVYQVTKEECERCVLDALKVGYRAIDTAQSYFNEEEGFVKSMKQVYVNAKFQELQYGERNDGGKIAWLAYETMAIDADIFNIMFITPLEGKMLYGSFNCILGMQDEWEKIAMYCIRTIKKVEEEQQ